MSQCFIKGKCILLVMMLLPFFSYIDTSGQNIDLKRQFPINPLQNASQNIPAIGTLNIVAVIVEFQPDDNRFTSGNGTFEEGAIPYLVNPGTNIDALPHDQNFFEARLEFVRNYFNRVSGGRLTIEYQLLPGIIQLDHPMEYYSPTGENPTFEPLAEMAGDTWDKVAAAEIFNPEGLNPEETAFVIFHAGIGRDIELTGTTLEKTPQDIPSIYLGSDALSRLLNNPSFTGFPAGSGDFQIANSIISPRTLSRSGTDISGNQFVLSLSANGLLAAQIGSHIGLPDLFNTEDGRSGIGAFGLMDGAGIFAFNGLFPPEPSAWERIHLGWESPFQVTPKSNNSIELPAASLRQENSIAKVNLSADEYFLIENRHRDPTNEGVTVTVRREDGTDTQQTFFNTDNDFSPENSDFDRLLEPGVIINVSNYDWALPGGYDSSADRNLNGGMLIWHVDESVIRNTIDENRVNANPDRRGIELKEADGAQDIGRPAQIGLTDNNPNGWAFDFWWSGNNATVTTQTGSITFYENRFGPDTTPTSNSHSGAPSFFELYDFSDNLPLASFSIQRISENNFEISERRHLILDGNFTTPRDNPLLNLYPYSLIIHLFDDEQFLVLPEPENIRVLQLQAESDSLHILPYGNSRQPFTSGLLVLADTDQQTSTNIEAWQWNREENRFEANWIQSLEPFPGLLSSSDGFIIDADHSSQSFSVSDGVLLDEREPLSQTTAEIDGRRATLTGRSISYHTTESDETFSSPLPEADFNQRSYISLIKTAANRYDLLLIGNDKIFIQETTGRMESNLLVDRPVLDWPALVDINQDGFLDIIYTDQVTGTLEAVSSSGAVINYFPVLPPDGVLFTGTPLVADLNGDGDLEVIVSGLDDHSMNIFAYNRRGMLMDPFPLLAGGIGSTEDKIINPVIDNGSLFAVSPSGDLREWFFPLMEDPIWSSKYGNHPWNKITGSVENDVTPEMSFGLLNRQETYNWPNPATNQTTIRFQLSQPGEVSIRIATISGRQIYSRTVESSGNGPEEIDIDTSTWASGGYVALVTAKTNDREEQKLIKIGIAR
jgi:hypothetical protein